MKKRILFFIAFISISAISFAKIKFDFLKCKLELTYKSTESIVIGIIDQREDVLSGKRKPDFVGIARGGYGNPFFIGTKSGEPFTKDITALLIRTFTGNGFANKDAGIIYSDNKEAALKKLESVNVKFKLLLIIHEWKTDRKAAFVKTWLDVYYDFELLILDELNQVLGTKRLAEIEPDSKDVYTSKKNEDLERPALDAFALRMNTLLNAKEIAAIFTGAVKAESANKGNPLPKPVKVENKETATPAKTESKNVADELIKLKKLLDDGAITEEEYKLLKKKLIEG
jgi:hypothetical protein